jgi:hypothetical protein
MLNRTGFGPSDGEAIIHYGDAEYRLMKPGAFVRCAVTGARIALEDLKYWSVDRQEAYVDAAAANQRFREFPKKAPE